ncbi:MAG: hypothetical protein A3J55_01005 [Candidatus Ryanbacteria bacterium RIFCSPHIGHO2_02_FULL_45_17b]|uniref:SUF system FeS cluster assembly SufBD core domain-containing protein n=1 Tax=Candidatus Ryanbacteria bacterium RIFCSPHIGHO2_01_FULL_45_22 TaxID=1802114 RepID=A0A1G2G0Y4_9BACT|nr:MAG: hypothetical protein A2719_03470 [Candidatus Ryanbacteria bacterium RIFCSPHIGHO2_01_FULL_45_22]OGZ47117.1 MAG: hypothetical protein A3J55_01005 [Candidatus Ryanbacteria bacterium RIFCSPHIGHO2_02_FULL_45_17b]
MTKTQEIFVPENSTKTLQSWDGAIVVHVSAHASLIITERFETPVSKTTRVTVRLEGEGSSVVDTSRYQGFKNAVLDMERVIIHAAPHTVSHVDVRGIAHDAARVMWRGRVLVEKSAKNARAFLQHDAMLTGKETLIDAAPFLEIYTDNALCKHSASVRRVQPADIFYIKSRGISEENARAMIREGFLA